MLSFTALTMLGSLLYYPTHANPDALARPPWQATQLAVAPEVTLRGLVRPAADPDAPWLLFFGGNAMGLDASQWVLETVRGDAPWGLAAFAYRGYDGSDGEPSEAALKSDALAITTALTAQHGARPEHLVLVGQSLGSGIAAYVAAELSKRGTPPMALVLLSPYVSMSRVFDEHVPLIPGGWLAPDPYRTVDLIGDVTCPITLIHGDRDTLIPIAHSRDLIAHLRAPHRLVVVPGSDHNGLWEDRRTVDAIRAAVAP